MFAHKKTTIVLAGAGLIWLAPLNAHAFLDSLVGAVANQVISQGSAASAVPQVAAQAQA